MIAAPPGSEGDGKAGSQRHGHDQDEKGEEEKFHCRVLSVLSAPQGG